MTTQALSEHEHHHEHHEIHTSSKVVFGFWVYVMTDFILFATLFATYAVLHNNTFGGPGIQQIATLPYVLLKSLVMLTSSFTCGLAAIALRNGNRNGSMYWLVITFLLGLTFVGLDFHEFANIIQTGNSWQTSAFLSAFFSLVGIHAMHVVVGMLWIIILLIQLVMQNATSTMKTRLTCINLFWNFLNIVWVFIFTIVYLMGAINV